MCNNPKPVLVITLQVGKRKFIGRFRVRSIPLLVRGIDEKNRLISSISKFISKQNISTNINWEYTLSGYCAGCNKPIFRTREECSYDVRGYLLDASRFGSLPPLKDGFAMVVAEMFIEMSTPRLN